MREVASGPVVVAGQGVTHGTKSEPNYPWIFDVENDPKELWDVSGANGWLAPTIGRATGAYFKSIAEFPNIKPGDEGPSTP